MNEIQRLKHEVECPTPTSDYVWSPYAVVTNTLYHNKKMGTASYTHKGCWVLTAKATMKTLEAQER